MEFSGTTGLLIIQGYMPKQLTFGTGGPKQVENLYTRAMLERAFCDFRDLKIIEEKREIHEGTSHGGMSAVINLTAIKPEDVNPHQSDRLPPLQTRH
jgi:hypothetical protein